MKKVRDHFIKWKTFVFTWIMIFILEVRVFLEKSKENNKYIKMIRNFIKRTDKKMGILLGICLIVGFWPLKNIYNFIVASEFKVVVLVVAFVVSFLLSKLSKKFDFNLKEFIRNKTTRTIMAFYYKNYFDNIKKLPMKIKVAMAINIHLEYVCAAISATICFLLVLGINYLLLTFNFSNVIISLFVALHKYLILQLVIVYLSVFIINICVSYLSHRNNITIQV